MVKLLEPEERAKLISEVVKCLEEIKLGVSEGTRISDSNLDMVRDFSRIVLGLL